ncbi:major vault protein [Acanthamoeba castellanii str. Neff]|uniref:Major vault protein n=1 Tax=Acanthamoeba castellanii (strain ATCC 30010 / Neff) TaxID=1257118 RepID=L8H933_ACACF|nr:major vault protein [Acanthamoeba castellanii str. Neff]ELR21737.1 major vault protein [Acanthamoeba castellanii str. Neff]
MASNSCSVPPNHYIHVEDRNTMITRLEVGPLTFTPKVQEDVVLGPTPMVLVPRDHHCVVRNPALRDDTGAVVVDKHGMVRLKHGDRELRFFTGEPFPLYPGEELE